MIRNSFIFYRSFFDLFNSLDDGEKILLLHAIGEYGLNGKLISTNKLIDHCMILIKPLIDNNNEKYINAIKGGIAKAKRKGTTNDNVNYNVTEDVNEEFNEKESDNLVREFIEHFNRSLTDKELNTIYGWIIQYGLSNVRLALRLAVINKAISMPYIATILKNEEKSQDVD